MRALKFLAAAALAVILSACGGGGEAPQTFSAERLQAAARATATVVTPTQAADQLMDAAQQAYAAYFPGSQSSFNFGPFRVRFYAATNTYLGVVIVAGQGYTMNGIYVVGGALGGTLQAPRGHGVVTDYLPFLTIDLGTGSGKTLTVQVSANGLVLTPIVLQNVPTPNTQQQFCDGLAADTTFTSIGATGGGTLTINSCSFNGTTGQISATLSITGPISITFPYTITYTYS